MSNNNIADLNDLRVVITQNQLISFAGSEIVTLELAEFLTQAGARVVIVTNSLGDPMMSELEKLNDVKVFVNQDDALEDYIEHFKPNLVWVHHQLLPEALLKPPVVDNASYVFHHMSPYHPTEFPVFSRLESQLADLILFNSVETRDEVLSRGVFSDTPKTKIGIFGNPAPDSFFRERHDNHPLGALLIVSNHLTDELRGIKTLLAERNVEVTTLGQNGDLQERLTPQLMSRYDAVISIGKTVQYALLSRTPIYCYDHFGGPGYLNAENIELSRERNFSGRNGGRRTTLRIVEEIIDGYNNSTEFMNLLEDDYLDNFRLSSQVQKVLEQIKKARKRKDKRPKLGRDQVVGLQKVNELNRTIQEILRVYNRESIDFKKQIEELATRNRLLEHDQRQKEEYITKIKTSIPYRLYGRLKKLANILKK